MQAVLVMFRSDGERRSFSIARDMTVVGRREDCDLRIPLGEVSRKHCRVVRDGDMLKIEDLGSSNGTYLNARRVQEALLAPGDSIQVGPVVFVLQIDGTPADDELSPVTIEIAADSAGSGSMASSNDSGMIAGVEELEPLDAAGVLEELGVEDNAGDISEEALLEPVEELDPLEPDLEGEESVDAENKRA